MSLLAPKSIAVIGASERSRWSTGMIANLERHGYTGHIRPVNPRGGTLGTRPVATSCRELGEAVDLGVLMVPSAASVSALEDLAAAGAPAAMVLTSGFAEAGEDGRVLQDQLVTIAAQHNIRLLGPNSLGFMNFVDDVVGWAAPVDAPSRHHGVGLVSQSGATAYFLADLAARQDIPVSYVVATGNEADLDLTTFACGLAADDSTRAIALFVESVRNPQRFIEAAEAAGRANKPLVVLKVGASEVTARSALAHTGALVGDDRVFDGICERYGIIRVHSLEDLMVTADIVGRTNILTRAGLAVISNSGGICEIAADAAETLGIDLPEIPESAAAEIRTAVPDYATPHNPLDLTGGVVPAEVERIVSALGTSNSYGAVLVPYYAVPTEPGSDDQRLADLHKHIALGIRSSTVPGFLVSYTATTVTDETRRIVSDLGLPYLACGMDRALVGLGHAFRWSARRLTSPITDPVPVRRVISQRPRTEADTLSLLADEGVPVVPRHLATSVDRAVDASRSWPDPSVLKIASAQIAHKTEIGGVALDVADPDVADTYRRIRAAGEAVDGAVIDGVLVSPMRVGGIELFVGCSYDPVWGPVIAVGLGGIWVEILADVALRPLPVSADEVVSMLRGLRAAAVLGGARGSVPADLAAVGRAVAAIGDVAVALGPDLAALEVNPLWVHGDHVEALDALAVWKSE